MIRYVGIALGIFLVGLLVIASALRNRDRPVGASLSLSEAIGGGIAAEEASAGSRYARAIEVRPFEFPEDHGPHDDYKLEWWYFTGNLSTPEGRRFGYQLTFFRTALSPPLADDTVSSAGESKWSTNQLYTAHFAVTDIENDRFYSDERFSRGAAGLAGAESAPFKVWIDDWEVAQLDTETFPSTISASNGSVTLDLTVRPEKPVIFQGDNGLSKKGTGVGQASYYYSYTRLATEGRVTVDGIPLEVSGYSWLDREWSTSLLGRTQVGWDWFSIQLDDGSEIMHFRLRERDSGSDEYRAGVIVDPDGTKRDLDLSRLRLTELDRWRNSRGDAEYPSRWTLSIPDEEIELEIVPWTADQELDLSIRYWEGAVRITGSRSGEPVSGNGYVELTGYTDSPAPTS